MSTTRIQPQWEAVSGASDGRTMIRCPNSRFTRDGHWVRCGAPMGFVDGGTTVQIRGVAYGQPQISPPGAGTTTHACDRCKQAVQVRRDAAPISPPSPAPLSPAA